MKNYRLDQGLLHDIINKTDNAVIVTDLQGRIQYVNKAFTNITEYDADEVIGQIPGALLQGPDTDAATVERIGDHLRQFKRVKETILNYSKSGRKYWLQLDIYPYSDTEDHPTHFLAIETDVTEIKNKEEEALEHSRSIEENITYAQRLQSALFRDSEQREEMFAESFVFDQPKDTVGGDFYIFDKIQNKRVVLLGDCTGHGASGAIMTAASISVIKELLNTYKTLSPAMIISKAQEKIAMMMGDDVHDSFEATLLFINDSNHEIRFATTNQDLYFFGKKTDAILRKVKKQQAPVDQTLEYETGDSIYLSSDGFKDQFGGRNDKKFSSKRLFELLEKVQTSGLKEQFDSIKDNFRNWKGESPQTDDVLLMGLKL
ncbi:MAG: PAS domain S-box protein [Bacteroidota bacterium]